MPARNPVVTGIESSVASQPARSRPTAARAIPTRIGEQRGELGIMRGADRRDRGQRAGEDRRDGRIRRDRHEAVGAERREGERACGEGIETRLRRHPGEPCRRQLSGDRDRRQHQPGDEIARQPRDAVTLKRREQPGRHPISDTPLALLRRLDVLGTALSVLLRVAHRGVVLAADVRDVDLRRRQLQVPCPPWCRRRSATPRGRGTTCGSPG